MASLKSISNDTQATEMWQSSAPLPNVKALSTRRSPATGCGTFVSTASCATTAHRWRLSKGRVRRKPSDSMRLGISSAMCATYGRPSHPPPRYLRSARRLQPSRRLTALKSSTPAAVRRSAHNRNQVLRLSQLNRPSLASKGNLCLWNPMKSHQPRTLPQTRAHPVALQRQRLLSHRRHQGFNRKECCGRHGPLLRRRRAHLLSRCRRSAHGAKPASRIECSRDKRRRRRRRRSTYALRWFHGYFGRTREVAATELVASTSGRRTLRFAIAVSSPSIALPQLCHATHLAAHSPRPRFTHTDEGTGEESPTV